MTRNMIITNGRTDKRLLFIEPEAMDYWLASKETFELRAEFPSNNMSYISVWHNDHELGCGHQRPSTWLKT